MGATALTDRCHQRTRCLQIGGVHIWGEYNEPQHLPTAGITLGLLPRRAMQGHSMALAFARHSNLPVIERPISI